MTLLSPAFQRRDAAKRLGFCAHCNNKRKPSTHGGRCEDCHVRHVEWERGRRARRRAQVEHRKAATA